MWFDGIRQPNTIYIANTSRGKDSTAMLRAITLMGWPLDMICAVDVWATDTIPAESPPMVAFKDEYDRKVFELLGIPVTRLCAIDRKRENLSFESMFYAKRKSGKRSGEFTGWPMQLKPWCRKLKTEKVDLRGYLSSLGYAPQINIVHYIGIAADELMRINRYISKMDKVLPLVQIGWNEDFCGLEAKYMDMLSPTYIDGQLRDGCWFCHNQGVGQLRLLRKNYPDLWALMLKWDADSPVTFHADGHTVKDFDRRFELEDEGFVDPAEPWKWSKLEEEMNYRCF